MEGRKTPSPYFKGIFDYWIGFVDDNPYCFLLTSMHKKDQKLDDTHKNNLSKTSLEEDLVNAFSNDLTELFSRTELLNFIIKQLRGKNGKSK